MKSLLGLSSFFGSGSCSVSCCFLLLLHNPSTGAAVSNNFY
ncbi:hypothetical protein GLYMA_15G005750v4 [Glycine max]|nr:hypothetical protein GLYMA_15G005750v4 [Glycine max]KAH1144841.1 hypothetical protein GYH30_040931 [Glycine max]